MIHERNGIGLTVPMQGWILGLLIGQVSESKAKAKDRNFMFKAKTKDTISSRTFQGLLPTHCFIIHYTIFIGLK